MELNVLMGHAPARVDDKGRLKIPTDFRKLIEEKYGADCFITSIDGERAMVYPLPVWYDFQARLGISRNTLNQRLSRLVDTGVLTRVPYQDHPPRSEYKLTAKGRALQESIDAIGKWATRWITEGDLERVGPSTPVPARARTVDRSSARRPTRRKASKRR